MRRRGRQRLAGPAALLSALIGWAMIAVLPVAALAVLALLLAAWLGWHRAGRQAWSVTRVGLATLPQRLGSASVVVIGIAGVVGVLVALLAMAAGFAASLRQSGSEDTAIVMRGGAQTEINSVLDHDSVTLIGQAPQVARGADGRPEAAGELVLVAALPKRSSGLDANVEVRGVSAASWALRPALRITAGRRFTPGLRELIVGDGAHSQFAGADLGATVSLSGQRWTVVGVFRADDAHDSELWGDRDVIAPAYRRGSSATSVTVRLTSAGALDAYAAALAADPRLRVDVKSTRQYYTEQSSALTKLITVLGVTVASIMAIGAVFGALNTMYAAVSARTREIATLRAIGFRGLPVVTAVLLETMMLALAGGVIGAAVAWALFDHYTASTLGANFTQVVFAFQVTPALIGTGLKWALAIGLLGGLFPALRAAQMPVTEGLREL